MVKKDEIENKVKPNVKKLRIVEEEKFS